MKKKALIKALENRDFDLFERLDRTAILVLSNELSDETLEAAIERFPEVLNRARKILEQRGIDVDVAYTAVNNGSINTCKIVRDAGRIETERASRDAREKAIGIGKKVLGFGLAAIGVIAMAYSAITRQGETEQETPEDNDLASGKRWNKETQNWEVDGVPVTYRVTWKDIDTGEEHERNYADIDDAYEHYEDKCCDLKSCCATFEHIPY